MLPNLEELKERSDQHKKLIQINRKNPGQMSQGKFGTELHLKRVFVQDIVEGKYRRSKTKSRIQLLG